MAKYIPGRNYIGSSEIATDLDVTGPTTFSNTLTVGVDDTGHDVKFFGATSGKYLLWDQSDNALEFADGVNASFGTNAYFNIQNNGTKTSLVNNTGNVEFRQTADDADIIFKCDDGSGSDTAYLTLDGGATRTSVHKEMRVDDAVLFSLGASADLKLFHNGTDSYIENDTGDLYIKQGLDDKDIIFQCDDGSGGLATYFFLDGSIGLTTFPDGKKLAFGSGNDLQIKHTGTDGFITNLFGDLNISTSSDDGDIIFQSDDGSGGTTEYFRLDGGQKRIIVSENTRFSDNVNGSFGNGNDLKIYHNGSASYIDAANSDLYIRQEHDDADIIFQCDDGSGGNATYFKLDGSAGLVDFSKGVLLNTGSYLQLKDSITAFFGTGNDLRIYHNGSNSYISQEGTGSLYIRNTKDDQDIIFQSDDGSGGLAEYFRLDGSTGVTEFSRGLRVADNQYLTVGTGSDLIMYHNGTNSIIQNGNGDLYIKNNADNSDIVFQCDDGSGGLTPYITLDGSEAKTIVSQTMEFQDNVKLAVGNSEDLVIDHNATNSRITNYTGDLKIINEATDKDIIFQSDDGSGGVTTFFFLDGSHGGGPITMFPDNSSINFGTTLGDLKITHDGSNSIIDNGTGALVLRQSVDDGDILFQCDNGSGGTTAYMTIDGGDTDIKVHKNFEIEKTLTMQHTADPSDPATGHSVMWSDTSGNLKVKINVGGSVVTRTLATGTD